MLWKLNNNHKFCFRGSKTDQKVKEMKKGISSIIEMNAVYRSILGEKNIQVLKINPQVCKHL